MANPMVTGFEGHSRKNPNNFNFLYNGKRYRVYPKPGVVEAPSKMGSFLSYIDYIAPKRGLSPWSFTGASRLFDFVPLDSKPQEAEQMSLFAAELDAVSDRLEEDGHIKEAHEIDIISNTIERLAEGE